ncbi:MAG TPA: NAD(P)-dependent oxidoreductase [Alphaproteobacteria bacterium]|nr:NAD(P)-dependent oxidoreductase [Alphaproteobacteria bacterium]
MPNKLRVVVSGDFLTPDGQPVYPQFDIGPLVGRPDIDLRYLENLPEIRGEQVENADALILSDARITADSFHHNGRLAVIARFGVGYDKVDIDACNKNAVALVITSEGVRRPVATSILLLMLALTGRFLEKQALGRAGPAGWARAAEFHGTGLAGKMLGSIGLGNIGAELFRLAAPLEMIPIAHDPFVDRSVANSLGVELLDLETLIRRSDILAVNCPLMPSTWHLMDARRLALMKPTAYLINTARGGIIDQAALTDCLRARRIAGAALDVLEMEPPAFDDPILTLDNVIITPHALCWTDQLFADCAKADVDAVLAVLHGKAPRGLVNREIVGDQRWRSKLETLAAHMHAKP